MTKFDDSVVVNGKRARKPKAVFTPEDFYGGRPQEKPAAEKKSRNKAAKGAQNKWATYRKVFKQALETIVRQEHYMEVRALQKSSLRHTEDKEDALSQQKIFAAKRTIFATLRAIAAENSGDTVWPELGGADGDGMVDVSSILCSRCGGEEELGNDILFCDRKDCCRAYHQQCLDPPIDPSMLVMDRDWFCWQCECLDDCLDVLGERLGTEYYDYRLVFPEVAHTFDSSGTSSLPAPGLQDSNNLDDDEDDDEDYFPDGEEDDQSGSRSSRSSHAEDSSSGEEREEEGSESTEESEIDEEELTGLLQDAQEDIQFASLSNVDPATSSHSGHRLRVRRAFPNDSTGSHADCDLRVYGERDVGRGVAKVHRGVVVVGRVVAFAASEASPWQGEASEAAGEGVGSPRREPSARALHACDALDADAAARGRWRVHFADGSEAQLGHVALVSALRLHTEHQAQCEVSLRQEARRQALEVLGHVSEENVVQGRRTHRAVDYAALSLEMFGNLWDEEDQRASDEEDGELDADTPRRPPRRRRAPKANPRRPRGEADGMEDGEDGRPAARRRRGERPAKS